MAGRLPAVGYACAVAAVIGAGLTVLAPTLELGLMADDFMGIAVARGEFSGERDPLDTFDFARGTASDTRDVQRLGMLPWWTAEGFRLAFLRPLSSALWTVDQALFGRDLWWYHAHSLCIWAALVVAAAALYRRLFSWPVAALACAIFALDQSQHMPVLWLSNRGGLYAMLFGVLGLRAHLAWRDHGRAVFWMASGSCVGVALLFGEWALPMLGYFATYELLGRDEPLRRRVLALLPVGVIALAFLVVRAVLDYGARGSGAYVDPAAEPLRFAALLGHRVPVFIADLVANLPADWWDHGSPWRDRLLALELLSPPQWAELPDWRTVHVGLGLCALAALAGLLRACVPRLQAEERRNLAWLLAGALLALLPAAGSFPSTRLTLAAMLGAAGAFALLIRHLMRVLLESAAAHERRRFAFAWMLGCVALHTQLLAPLGTRLDGQVDYMAAARAWVLSAELDDARVASQRVMMLASSDFITTYFWAYTWHYHGRPMPRSYYPLSTSPTAHDIERPEPNVLVLRPLGAQLLASPGEQMFRAPELSFRDGELVTLPGMQVRIEGMRDRYPTSVRLTFDVPVDDPSLVFLVSTEQGLTRFELPEVGQTVRLRAAAHPSFLGLLAARELARFGPYPDELAYAPTPWFIDYRP